MVSRHKEGLNMKERQSRDLTEKPRLMDRVRAKIRLKHYSKRTEKAYVGWIFRFIRHHELKHPVNMGSVEVTAFLTHLAVERKVSASTQNQALSAILFLYRDVLGVELPWLDKVVRAKRSENLPVVLSREEIRRLFSYLDGEHLLMASLLYGSGLRLLECCQLRVKDVDFSRNQITVRKGKGGKDRVTIFPEGLKKVLRVQIQKVTWMHSRDLKRGAGKVLLEESLHRKYPNAGKELAWQWVFPGTRVHIEAKTGDGWRHHLHESVLQRVVKEAGRRSGIPKRITCHVLRHSFATHLLEDGYDIRTIQKLMGHQDVRTTMKYTHVLKGGPMGVKSPLDKL